MAKFIERLIECPFYLGEGGKFINCEGEDGKSRHDYFVIISKSRNMKRMYALLMVAETVNIIE